MSLGTPVNANECGDGYSVDAGATANTCVGTAGFSGEDDQADRDACCTPNSCAAVALANGLIPDAAGDTPCANGSILTTSQTCDVKCDTDTHVDASGTLTCVEAAVGGSTQLSGFTCTSSASAP